MNIDKHKNFLGWERWHVKRGDYDCSAYKKGQRITWEVLTCETQKQRGTASSLADGIARAVAWADKNKG